ncbi:hypothetical protein EVAR_76903_1 [Eumeta japonica]|uniref:Uncharacterized protein n=1 Tax=Eumeta variegata TaxID=151549 RepID=A0A4C1SGX8_EUMVA|nr:hypothetical protein EVAR_76903_1 [Eumeta japonica]
MAVHTLVSCAEYRALIFFFEPACRDDDYNERGLCIIYFGSRKDLLEDLNNESTAALRRLGSGNELRKLFYRLMTRLGIEFRTSRLRRNSCRVWVNTIPLCRGIGTRRAERGRIARVTRHLVYRSPRLRRTIRRENLKRSKPGLGIFSSPHTHAARRAARAHLRPAPAPARLPRRSMPAVKVFNIFGGQKAADKRATPAPAAKPAAAPAGRTLYRTFSVAPDRSSEQHKGKVTTLAANIEKKIVDSEPLVKLSSDKVQRFLNKININVVSTSDRGPAAARAGRSPAYENVNIVRVDDFDEPKRDKTIERNKDYSSIYENVTVIGLDHEQLSSDRVGAAGESQLNRALESFDRILCEFSTNSKLIRNVNNFVPPKLQKSKTCSIIESRCILKTNNLNSQNDCKIANKVKRNNSIDKTTSLWNLADMKGKQLTSPLLPLPPSPGERTNADKYATYKISSKSNQPRVNGIKSEDLKKLDVKTRILKKTLSNPPSAPVPVASKAKVHNIKKIDKKIIDSKITKPDIEPPTKAAKYKEASKSQMQKAKSVWEIGNEPLIPTVLERTRSSTSIVGSPSKIPVIRSQMTQNKFSSTRALFSPTPVDLNNVDQARECAQRKKNIAPRKNIEKLDTSRPAKQKSQLNLKSDAKRQNDKTKRDPSDKKAVSSPKTAPRDYSDEINAVRAKLQQRKINKRDVGTVTPGLKRNGGEPERTGSAASPVKTIVKKLELKTALEARADPDSFVSCKVIPAAHKEICVANTTFHNHLSKLVNRQVRCAETRSDVTTCIQNDVQPLRKRALDKISDAQSDCSDDSGHASNDHDAAFDLTEHATTDESDCRYEVSKPFEMEVPPMEAAERPVRPARRNEVVSGTRASAAAPKVDEQVGVRDAVYASIAAARARQVLLPRRPVI